MLKQVLDLEQEKYQREKAVAEIINIKCHDLKHRISNLESRIDSEELQEINRVVDEYEGNLHTGNATLDVVLRNKNLLCQQNDINFTCIANGKLLSFMKDSDIYALFGNLMDNGIEAAQRLENKEMRVISLTVTEKFSMIFIHMENYFHFIGKTARGALLN
ncbi:MAG: GHKL domain-containing protein [Ruminococcus sp.]